MGFGSDPTGGHSSFESGSKFSSIDAFADESVARRRSECTKRNEMLFKQRLCAAVNELQVQAGPGPTEDRKLDVEPATIGIMVEAGRPRRATFGC